MPELAVKDIRLPELHLPEMKRDDIVRSLSEISLPEVDVAKAVSKFEWPRIDLPSVDVGKAIAGAAAATPFGRRTQRPRWPLAVGALIVAGLAGWAVMTNAALRARLAQGASAIGARITALRSNQSDRLELDPDETIAFPAAETAPMKASRKASGSTDYPSGLGSNNGDGIPALEETGSRT